MSSILDNDIDFATRFPMKPHYLVVAAKKAATCDKLDIYVLPGFVPTFNLLRVNDG